MLCGILTPARRVSFVFKKIVDYYPKYQASVPLLGPLIWLIIRAVWPLELFGFFAISRWYGCPLGGPVFTIIASCLIS